MGTPQFTEEKEESMRRKSAIGFLILSTVLLTGLALPWLQMDFSWSTTSNLTRGELHFDTNGLGIGNFFANFSYKDKQTDQMMNYVLRSTTYVPLQITSGIVIGLIAALNIVMASSFLNTRVKQILPAGLTNFLENRWGLIILIESGVLLAIVSLFTTFYFYFPFTLSTKSPIGEFPKTINSLLELYANTFSLFTWMRSVTQASNPSWSRTLTPGLGLYFTFFGSLGLLYIWYLYYTSKKNWPEVWQRRSLLMPLMIAIAFMPIARKYSKVSASTLPLLLSPFLNHVGGILYLGLVGGLTFLFYRSAKLESNVNRIVGKLYAMENLTEEEFLAKRSQVDAYRNKVALYRKLLVPILIGILVVVGLMMYDFAMFYQSYVGETLGAEYITHTPTDWGLIFSPLITIVLIAVFRQ